ncbi:MAG: hypothetical protein KDA97_13620 [Acidimicrobiales bacterium]|nr:hypothetical protein [Acidimicrobiales bacterium]
MLSDGTYDVVVVDADHAPDADDAIHVEVTILAGSHKGEVVAVTASGLGRDPLDLLAVPGTLTVADGVPRLVIED